MKVQVFVMELKTIFICSLYLFCYKGAIMVHGNGFLACVGSSIIKENSRVRDSSRVIL